MMQKVIEVGSWDGAGMDQPVNLIKVSNRGLIGNDRADFLKIASHVFADAIDNIKVARDELPIHLNAIGATEGYGANRNGDGFKEATCKLMHSTFVKDACYYANHQNKNPAKRYGTVKLSAYNDTMRRVELLLIGNATKEASARNGGLRMKQATIDKLNRGELVPFSMACKIAHDVCNNCFNKAANRSQYCTEDTCISPNDGRRMFGCKSGLTKVASDGRQQYVENPNAGFFDISEVGRGADRIAQGMVAEYMQKAASTGYTPGGAELAEIWSRQGADLDLLSPEATMFRQDIVQQVKIARTLAEFERNFESSQTERDFAFARAFSPMMQPPMELSPLGTVGSTKLASGLHALAGQKVAMPLRDFLRLVVGSDAEKLASLSDSVPRYLPGVFGRLVADENLESSLRSNPFAVSQDLASGAQRQWASKQAAAFSVDPSVAQDRVCRSALNKQAALAFIPKGEMVKTAAATDESEMFARQYAMYKLAFVAALPINANAVEIGEMVVRQNYVDIN